MSGNGEAVRSWLLLHFCSSTTGLHFAHAEPPVMADRDQKGNREKKKPKKDKPKGSPVVSSFGTPKSGGKEK